MNLIRMLRVSDTFTAGEIPMGRYHVVVGVRGLPRFGGGHPAVREPARPGGGPCPRWECDSRLGMARGPSGGPGENGFVEGVDAKERGGGSEARPGEGERPGNGWIMRLVRGLGERLHRRRNPFVGGGPRLARTVVPRQGSLRLEGVKVVRNDLSDTDFEVIPARRSREAPREPASSVACKFRVEATGQPEATELQVSNL